MLQNIRDRLTGKFAIAILALLCVPFLFFGINYNFSGSGYAAKVNDVEIPLAQLQNEYQATLAQYAELDYDLPAELRGMIREGVLRNLIREVLVNQHVVERGYRITDKMVTEFIQSVPQFQADGRFSKESYYDWLNARAMSPAAFEERQRATLRVQQFQRGIAATGFVTPAEYRRYLNLYGEQRRAAIATFDVESVAEGIDISEEQVASYYESNAMEFQAPETADIDYIVIDRSALRQQVAVSEQDLEEYYRQSASRYLQDERRQARHILIPFGGNRSAAEEQARALLERATAGEPFEELARQYSADTGTAEQGGDLGLMMQSQLPPELGAAVFSMSAGEIIGPVESEFGFHLVRLDEVQAGGPLPLEEVRGELENELRELEAEEAYQNLERQLSDALFDGLTLEEIAAGAELEVQSVEGMTRSGGGPFGANQAVIDAVFDPRVLVDGMVSEIVELDANRSALFKVREYHEAAQRPLEEVREQIAATLRADHAREIVRERAQQLQVALHEGADFQAAATEAGAEATAMHLIGRQDEAVDTRVLEALFRAPKPAEDRASIGDTVSEEGDYAVFSVTAVIPGRPESIPLAERDAEKERLTSEAGAADYTALVLELERRAEIVLAEDALATPEF